MSADLLRTTVPLADVRQGNVDRPLRYFFQGAVRIWHGGDLLSIPCAGGTGEGADVYGMADRMVDHLVFAAGAPWAVRALRAVPWDDDRSGPFWLLSKKVKTPCDAECPDQAGWILYATVAFEPVGVL